jgi:DNA-directed RNA polymerase specialized sigma24 family protein
MRKEKTSRDDTLRPHYDLDKLEVVALGPGWPKQSSLKELLEFGKTLPAERRRAVELWLEEYSYRKIAEILQTEGYSVSHIAVHKWIGDVLRAFFREDPVKKASGF